MAGSPIRRERREMEKQLAFESNRVGKEHVDLALAYRDGNITDEEYRKELLDMDYGEIHRLWRMKYLRCVNPEDLTEEQLIEAAKRAHGIVGVMGRLIGIDRQEIVRVVNKYNRVKRVIAEERENIVDLAECRLFEAANDGQEWAIKMVLYCQGRDRGWTKETLLDKNKGKILEALETMTNMSDEELTEYDNENGFEIKEDND